MERVMIRPALLALGLAVMLGGCVADDRYYEPFPGPYVAGPYGYYGGPYAWYDRPYYGAPYPYYGGRFGFDRYRYVYPSRRFGEHFRHHDFGRPGFHDRGPGRPGFQHRRGGPNAQGRHR